MFENRVLRKIFGLKRDKVTGEWGRHNEELKDLYEPPNIIQVIKSRTGWARRVARIWREREDVCTGFWWGNLREIVYLEDPGVDERIILRWIFKTWNGVGAWIGLNWIRIGIGGGRM
jgi:hypothetical protein